MINENDYLDEYNERFTDSNDLKVWEEAVCDLGSISYLLRVTIPAAELRNDRIGHTLLICPYPRITECILKVIRESVKKGKAYSINIRKGYDQEIQAGEFAAMLTSASSMDVLLCRDKLHFRNIDLKKIWSDVLREQVIRVTMGRGPMAPEVRIDLLDFSLVSCIQNRYEVDDELYPYFENIIDFDETGMKVCCELEAEAIAAELGLKITKSAANTLAVISGLNHRKIKMFLRRIRDYCEVENLNEHHLTDKTIIEVVNKLHIV